MNYKIIFFLLILSNNLISQENRSMFISTSIGLGIIEGHNGYAVDGEIGKRIISKFNLGVYYNLMSSQMEINPEYDRYNVSIEYLYLENLSNYYTRNIQRSQNSIGIQLTYTLVNSSRWLINLGGGPNYNNYKMLDLTITSSEPFVPHGEYLKWHDHGISHQFVADFYYRVSMNFNLGLKTRFMDFKDHNISFMLSSAANF